MWHVASRLRGFTLLEMMVALAVLSIALAAMIKGVAANASNATYLRDRTLAHWVGMNVVAEQRLLGRWSELEIQRGEEEMGRHTWYWSARLSKTFDEDVRRLDVEVRGSEEHDATPLATLIAFVPPPQVSP
ncbi:MAG: type II secretion system minor pseudopilin GspI [Gammaproteobacteria bacterium]|nr:type II secretion system minor pseudopilin GspI [Gammaproteobacteria bacterium]